MAVAVKTKVSNTTKVTGRSDEPVTLISQPVGPRLVMQIAYDEGQWVAVEQLTGSFGEGDSKDAAIADLFVSMAKLMRELRANSNLAARLVDQLRALEDVFATSK